MFIQRTSVFEKWREYKNVFVWKTKHGCSKLEDEWLKKNFSKQNPWPYDYFLRSWITVWSEDYELNLSKEMYDIIDYVETNLWLWVYYIGLCGSNNYENWLKKEKHTNYDFICVLDDIHDDVEFSMFGFDWWKVFLYNQKEFLSETTSWNIHLLEILFTDFYSCSGGSLKEQFQHVSLKNITKWALNFIITYRNEIYNDINNWLDYWKKIYEVLKVFSFACNFSNINIKEKYLFTLEEKLLIDYIKRNKINKDFFYTNDCSYIRRTIKEWKAGMTEHEIIYWYTKPFLDNAVSKLEEVVEFFDTRVEAEITVRWFHKNSSK